MPQVEVILTVHEVLLDSLKQSCLIIVVFDNELPAFSTTIVEERMLYDVEISKIINWYVRISIAASHVPERRSM